MATNLIQSAATTKYIGKDMVCLCSRIIADHSNQPLDLFINMKSANCSASDLPKTDEKTKLPEKYGFDLYPERRGEKFQPSMARMAFFGEGRTGLDKMKCERNVYKCIMKSPIIKLMMNALRSSGCPVDIRRHISCEVCDISVTGGYDQELNQVVICQNTATSEGKVQGVLMHEMIHMFDYCRNDLDFKNDEHLACTEIRAANLAHCSFMSAWLQGDASPFNIKQRHQNCVKTKAAYSIMAIRGVDEEAARKIVDKVFDKCYADLEPVGRRIKRNSVDMYRANQEGFLYGYDEEA